MCHVAADRSARASDPCHGWRLLLLILCSALPLHAQTDSDTELTEARRLTRAAETARIAVVERAARSSVCIVDAQRRGGGSGVIIDEHGYGLTNFHVVANLLDTRKGFGGLSDGKLYPLEVLGIDPGGDVAMFRLTGRDRFDPSPLGDSEEVAVGDAAIAMGNPFVLADDYTPTVTLGIVTGVHRYQWGEGNQLVYSDCIQVDTAINPGNSGGPLFNARGEVIGINGRISINARGRFNVGVGYAISANQIKRFMPGLRAGLLVEHGSLVATVDDVEDRGVVFDRMYDDAPAWNAGIRPGDRLVSFAGHAIQSRNHFASVLGTYPGGWTVEVGYEREGRPHAVVTRLEALSSGLNAPFDVNPGVNAAAVGQVLRRFAAAVGARGRVSNELPCVWSAQETHVAADPSADGAAPSDPASVAFHWNGGDAEATLERSGVIGGRSSVVTFTTDAAWWTDAEGKRFDLKPTEAMNYAALRVVLGLCGGHATGVGSDAFTHVGADAWTGWSAPRGEGEPPILEVLERAVAANAVARFGFDANGLLRRVIVADKPSGAETVLDLLDYAGPKPVRFPKTIAVSTAEGVTRYETAELVMVETE